VKEFLRRDLRVAVVPWILSRLIVVSALMTARFLHEDVSILPRPIPLAQGLFAWDAGWYRAIAEFGYTGVHDSALRFFPLLPALSRGLGFVFLGHEDVAVIVIANLAALVLAALLYRLALVDTGDEALAVRAAWFVLVLSPAVALVLGYAESLAMSLSIGAFLAIRSQRWALAGSLALLAGLARAAAFIWVPSCSPTWRASSSRTFPTRAARPPCST
jgi:Gpi18-like mannosyltransferase